MTVLRDFLDPPIDASGAAFDLQARVKTFEGTTASLELLINAWLAIAAGPAGEEVWVGRAIYIGSQGVNSRVLLPYAYFTAP